MTTIAIEAIEQPAKTFDIMWISTIVIQTPSPGQEGSVLIEYHPMSSDGTLHPSTSQIVCPTLFAALAQVSELNVAFGAILAAVEPLKAYVDAQE